MQIMYTYDNGAVQGQISSMQLNINTLINIQH